MIELLSMYNGSNNGRLFLSVRDATARLGLSDLRPAMAAFGELQELGLAEKTFDGYFSVKTGEKSRASAWRLTWLDDEGHVVTADKWPTVDAEQLAPRAQKRLEWRQKVMKRYLKDYQQGKFAVQESTTVQARSVEVFTPPAKSNVVQFPASTPVPPERAAALEGGESPTHIYDHGGQGVPVELIRTDLLNFLRAARDEQRETLPVVAELEWPSISSFAAGGSLAPDQVARLAKAISQIRGEPDQEQQGRLK